MPQPARPILRDRRRSQDLPLPHLQGEELIAAYRSPPGVQRGFCRARGSILPILNPAEELSFTPVGPLDDDPGARLATHAFAASKASRVEIRDELPKFDAYPPGFPPDPAS